MTGGAPSPHPRLLPSFPASHPSPPYRLPISSQQSHRVASVTPRRPPAIPRMTRPARTQVHRRLPPCRLRGQHHSTAAVVGGISPSHLVADEGPRQVGVDPSRGRRDEKMQGDSTGPPSSEASKKGDQTPFPSQGITSTLFVRSYRVSHRPCRRCLFCAFGGVPACRINIAIVTCLLVCLPVRLSAPFVLKRTANPPRRAVITSQPL